MTKPDPHKTAKGGISSDFHGLKIDSEGETDIVIRRDFNHPPRRVWQALIEPALIQQWLGEMMRCEMDARPGGSFHFQFEEFAFFGPVLVADPPNRLIHVEQFSGDVSYRVEITTDLAATGAGTRMTMVMRYADTEARAAAIQQGMTDGMDQVYSRLEALQFVE